jgi:hypothetical protein
MSVPGEWIEVTYEGGLLDGARRSLPVPLGVEGYQELHPPPTFTNDIREAERPEELTAVFPDATWERYVLHRHAHGWVFEYAGPLSSDAPPIP